MDIKEIRRRNLRALMQYYLIDVPGAGKAGFADEIGIPPSQLSQLTSENPTRNIGDALSRRIESNLHLPHAWMDSPRWGDIESRLAAQRSPAGGWLEHIAGEGEVSANDKNSGNPHRYLISKDSADNDTKRYTLEVLSTEFSCGHGYLNTQHPEVIRSIELEPEEARRMFGGRKASALKIATAMGDSMLGSIVPGELVVLDITVERFVGDGIYAFVYGDNLHIKRLQLLKDRLIVISDNASYDKWEVTTEDEELFHIQGLVIGKWQMSYTRLG
ncbi:S24 family peptidase [Serratia fonticola]|uniref:S24 family peptidase n=1 Tax=Serratia fonticola TaxID=47917 RepID=UPI001AE91E4F|nr:helix-turn-helix transcriptional regulator [Serratia fonticola]MBP0998228.1 helix-turn-helix transcriptional regulator [Serratia fonticola]